jgi:hypothetical protein
VLNNGWKRDSLQTMIYVYVYLTWGLVQLKTHFETWITKNNVNGVSLFHLSHLITLMAYLGSQWTPNVQIKYFKFYFSIYGLFVLNRAWKRYSVKIMIFLYVCPTCSVVKLKTRFETWKVRNDVIGVSLFHLTY